MHTPPSMFRQGSQGFSSGSSPIKTGTPTTPANPTKRRELDITKLAMKDYTVTSTSSVAELWVTFHGPKDTLYEGGVWNIHVELPETYPYKSPSLGFANKIFHPNVDEASGTICLDVINQAWTPMYDLLNVFEVFLPQLLRYPNPSDPLNGEAAGMLLQAPEKYAQRVREHTARYATPERAAESLRTTSAASTPTMAPCTTPQSTPPQQTHSGVARVLNGSQSSESELEELEI